MHLASGIGGSVNRRLVLLAPPNQPHTSLRGVATVSSQDVTGADHPLLSSLQKLRGRICVREGVVLPSDLDSEGRHVQPADYTSWHILCADGRGQVHGCVRYQRHARNAKFADLGVAHSPLGRSPRWQTKLQTHVNRELAMARRRNLAYVEVGTWVVSEALRNSGEAVRMVMAVYALGRAMGGALGIATATTRHNSALILNRLGGEPLDLPAYYDPRYRSIMRVLRFDSARPNLRYLNAIDSFEPSLAHAPTTYPNTVPAYAAVAASA